MGKKQRIIFTWSVVGFRCNIFEVLTQKCQSYITLRQRFSVEFPSRPPWGQKWAHPRGPPHYLRSTAPRRLERGQNFYFWVWIQIWNVFSFFVVLNSKCCVNKIYKRLKTPLWGWERLWQNQIWSNKSGSVNTFGERVNVGTAALFTWTESKNEAVPTTESLCVWINKGFDMISKFSDDSFFKKNRFQSKKWLRLQQTFRICVFCLPFYLH